MRSTEENTPGDEPLRIATAYSPPAHAPSTDHRTKAEVDANEHH